MSLRDETRFYATVAFLEILDTYDVYVKATIAAHLKHFEQAWCNSNHDGDLPSSNQFEAYTDVRGPYRLGQIRLGPGHGYRALVMLLNGRAEAYWVYLFKKGKRRQPEDMQRGRIKAQQLWIEIEKRQ